MTSAPVARTLAQRLDEVPVSGWHRRTTAIVGVGSFFDLYEVFLGGVLAAVLAEKWDLGTGGKGLVIASAFAGMFVGANVMSALADRWGRRRVFFVNLASYSLLSVVAAFSPDLTFLVVARFLAGIGLGAELVLVDTYLAELLPSRIRGRYISWAYVVGFVGVPIAALLGGRLVGGREILGLDGWRWLLVLGGLGALLVLVARRALPESPRWLANHGRAEEAEAVVRRVEAASGVASDVTGGPATVAPAESPAARVPLRRMWEPAYRRRTTMLAVFQVLQTVGYYGFGTLAPLVLVAKGYDVTESLGYAALSFAGYPIGALVAVPVVERLERKHLIVVSALLLAGFGLVFGFAGSTPVIVVAGFLLTVSSNVFSNAFHVYQTEIFPTEVRATAVGFCYSLSRAVSAVFPFVAVGALDAFSPGGVFLGSAVVMLVLCLDVGLLGPRTTGRSLEEVSA